MRKLTSLIVALSLPISACGSGATSSGDEKSPSATAAFTPPALVEERTFEAMRLPTSAG
jgi:hypothetical protein